MVGNFFNKNIIKKQLVFVVVFGIFLFLFGVRGAQAGWFSDLVGNSIFSLLSILLYLPIYFLGKLVTAALIPLMIWVSGYNNFIGQEAVTIGWTVVRDLANLFVVGGILIIAVGTLLNIETYSYKKLLPKLIMAAIAINFSKMIMGLLIDVSQVITLTFVRAYQEVAAGNLLQSLGIEQILGVGLPGAGWVSSNSETSVWPLMGSLILGVMALVIVAAVMVVLIAYFVGRIIILWVAIILSPLLFVLPFIPSGDKFASQVWGMVSKQLFSGPVLAFFLWLSFKIMTIAGNKAILQSTIPMADAEKFTVFISTFGRVESLLNFIVVVGLLFSSLMLASQMGAVGGRLAGDFAGKLQGAGKWLATKTPGFMGRRLDRASLWAQTKAGIQENKRISLRPSVISKAIKTRWDRKEKEIYEPVQAGMTDRFARKDDKGKAYGAYKDGKIYEKRQDFEKMPGGDDENLLLNKLRKLIDEKTGRVKMGSEIPAEALYLQLAKVGGLKLAVNKLGLKNDNVDERNYNPENFVKLTKRLFGEDRDGLQTGFRAQKVATENYDAQLAGSYKVNPDSGKMYIASADERRKGAIEAAKDKTGVQPISHATEGTYFEIDSDGNSTGRFHESGAKIFAANAQQWVNSPRSGNKKLMETISKTPNIEERIEESNMSNEEKEAAQRAVRVIKEFVVTGEKVRIAKRDVNFKVANPPESSTVPQLTKEREDKMVQLEKEIEADEDNIGNLNNEARVRYENKVAELKSLKEASDGVFADKRPLAAKQIIDSELGRDKDSFINTESEVANIADRFRQDMQHVLDDLKAKKYGFGELFSGGDLTRQFREKIDSLAGVLKDEPRRRVFDFVQGDNLLANSKIKDSEAQERFIQNLSNIATRLERVSNPKRNRKILVMTEDLNNEDDEEVNT